MTSDPDQVALAVAGLVFVAFVLVKVLRSREPSGERARLARTRIVEARTRAVDHARSPGERAEAFREMAIEAIEGLGRPSLAASYARRAERLEPDAADSLGLIAVALRRASRYRALERMLWRRIAAEGSPAVVRRRAVEELIGLYRGPLRRPEIAESLHRLAPPG